MVISRFAHIMEAESLTIYNVKQNTTVVVALLDIGNLAFKLSISR